MTLEQALRLTNRNMIAFDLLLGSAAIARPGGDPEGARPRRALARRQAPVPPLRADLAHLRRRPRGRRPPRQRRATGRRWPGCAAPRSPPTRSGRGSPAVSRPGAKLGLRLAGVANLAMAAGFAWMSKALSVGQFDGQPSMRWSLRGLNEEGDEAWLIRGIARKLYHCPGCHGDIEVGDEHTVVQYVRRLGGTDHHHWHRRCAEELLIPELGSLKPGARLASRASRSSSAAAASRPAAGAAEREPALRRARARSTPRIGRTYCVVGADRCCCWRSIVFLPLGPARRARRPGRRRLARPRQRHQVAAADRRGRRAITTTGLLGEVFYSGAVALSLTHPEHEQPPPLRELARRINYGRLIVVDLALRRRSSSSACSLFVVPGVARLRLARPGRPGGRDRGAHRARRLRPQLPAWSAATSGSSSSSWSRSRSPATRSATLVEHARPRPARRHLPRDLARRVGLEHRPLTPSSRSPRCC